MSFQSPLIFAVLLWLNVGLGQAPPEKQLPGKQPLPSAGNQRELDVPVFRDTTDLVNVTFTVRDHQHHLVPDLKKDDFELDEDNKRQEIGFFSSESELPLTLGLLVDCSGSQTSVLLKERDATRQFLDSVLRDEDRVFILTFGSELRLIQDFTNDRNLLLRTLEQLHPCGATRFFDAVFSASRSKLFGRQGRKALVAITDAGDNASRLSAEQALASLFRADAPAYVVFEPWRPTYPSFYLEKRIDERFAMLRKWTEASGGRTLRHSGLRKAFLEIGEELRHQYTIGYRPRNSNPGGRYRTISIRTVREGFQVQARKGYFAPPS